MQNVWLPSDLLNQTPHHAVSPVPQRPACTVAPEGLCSELSAVLPGHRPCSSPRSLLSLLLL